MTALLLSILVLERKEWVLVADPESQTFSVVEEVEFFQCFLKVMRSPEKLGRNARIFKWEVYVECMSDFVSIHVKHRHWG